MRYEIQRYDLGSHRWLPVRTLRAGGSDHALQLARKYHGDGGRLRAVEVTTATATDPTDRLRMAPPPEPTLDHPQPRNYHRAKRTRRRHEEKLTGRNLGTRVRARIIDLSKPCRKEVAYRTAPTGEPVRMVEGPFFRPEPIVQS